ncbi:helix-turn-helix domain-containing protein [Roseibium alexandrii]|uniref:Winged helix-turn-helix domain-containing protein n=1 Tax=Roseibium alexandrii (strain DSM 17067 / NCIMB 14079 / DFL-11) TaxID=244592 RepID=A0A5E8GZ53_ROSAD|nr:helix-turn-helix domain-containing protein [Roseibium alexandrii]EEE45374.1 hypothetical protein SADFL11_2663 [Roseibium alexandrii DFL-11]
MKQTRILTSHFARKRTITVREAIDEHRIMSLPRRILDLEDEGFRFERHRKTNKVTGQRYVQYELTHWPGPAETAARAA